MEWSLQRIALRMSMAARSPDLVSRETARALSPRLGWLALTLAPHDWLLLVQLGVLLCLVIAGAGPTRSLAIGALSLDLAWFAIALAVEKRAAPSPSSPIASAFYRLSLIGVIIATYVELRWILPVVVRGLVDADLLSFDLYVFGYEPALAWDRFVTPTTTEWFAFFYYSYFFILALYAIPIALVLDDGPALREFAFGILFVFCIGHLTYVLVPAVGPHLHLDTFERQLHGGLFWKLVQDAVTGAGAGTDVFPSMHTAGPTFLTLYAFRLRHSRPFRYVWPVTAFFASQIIIATMFLRWHYLIDILAGIFLAVVAWMIAPRVAAWDARRRKGAKLPSAFSPPPIEPRRDRVILTE